jgi:predicted pyridoxine 5'-phosphate oxidase superfamily flavin-nucleotide-binding protein
LLETLETLEALYSKTSPASLCKVADHLTPLYQAWFGAGRFCVLSTIGPSGADGSARGDLGPVVRVNGHASLTADPDLCASFSDNKGSPVCVMVITVQEVYIQCEKSVKRAAFW